MSLRGKKYSGTLYGRKHGSSDAFTLLGNLTELTTSKSVETDELLSTGREDFGEAIEVENKPGPTELSLQFNTFDKEGMARALMGTAAALSATVVTFTDLDMAHTKTGWIKLEHSDIDPAQFAIKDGATTLAATTYELNPRLGMVRFNDSSALAEGKALKYTGKTKGTSGYQIDANTLQSLPLELYLDGKDRITGRNGTLSIPHAVLSSDGDMNWLSDDWWANGLKGKLVKDQNKPTMRFTEFE